MNWANQVFYSNSYKGHLSDQSSLHISDSQAGMTPDEIATHQRRHLVSVN